MDLTVARPHLHVIPELTQPNRDNLGLIERIRSGHKIITFTGASGAGKSSLMKRLIREDGRFAWMKSVTTRVARESDYRGEYMHVTDPRFVAMERRREFLWSVGPHGNRYGTLKRDIEEALQHPYPTLMHVVPECVQTLQLYAPGRVLSLFVYVGDREELQRRLQHRDPDQTADYYAERIQTCLGWEKQARAGGLFAKFFDNSGKFDTTYDNLVHCLVSLPPCGS